VLMPDSKSHKAPASPGGAKPPAPALRQTVPTSAGSSLNIPAPRTPVTAG
jgi:hypothetical protein